MTDKLGEVLKRLDTDPIGTGFTFTEGPVWHPDGYLLFTDESNVHRLDADTGKLITIRSSTAGSNGMTLDPQRRLVMCDGLDRRVTRMEADGTIITVAGSYQGKQLNRPNDVVFRSDGTMYFTDPGAWAYHTPAADLFKNYVYGVTPDGTVFRAALLEYPNGLALSPDESILYVANTRYHKHVSAYHLLPDGTLADHRVFAELPQNSEQGVPDGIKVDVDGRVYCTGPGGLWVFRPSSDFVGKIRLPELPANLAWGDSDNRTLYITARTSVYRIRMKVPGTRMPLA